MKQGACGNPDCLGWHVAPLGQELAVGACEPCGMYATDSTAIEAARREGLGASEECGVVLPSCWEYWQKTRARRHYAICRVRGSTGVGWREAGPYPTIKGALVAISLIADEEHDTLRVVEIPPGESLDYDGTVVAEVRCGRLF